MDKDAVHDPELPGVRTYQKDALPEGGDLSFGGIKLTMPEKAVDATPHRTEERRSGGGHSKQLFDVERAFNNDAVQEGTIVTDRKQRHVSIGTLLKSAVTEWWGNTQKSVELSIDKLEFLKEEKEPTIESAEARAHIIQEAAKHAQQVPRDDHTIVVEKIRTFAHDAEVATGKPFIIKEPVDTTSSHWLQPVPAKESVSPAPTPTEPKPTLDMRTSVVAPTTLRQTSPLSAYAPLPKHEERKISTPTSVTRVSPTLESFRTPEKMPGKALSAREKKGEWSFFSKTKNVPPNLRVNVGAPPRAEFNVPRIEAPSVPRRIEYVQKQQLPTFEMSSISAVEEPTPAPSDTSSVESRLLPTPPVSHWGATLAKIPRTLIISTIILVGGGLGVLTAIFVVHNVSNDVTTLGSTTGTAPLAFLKTDGQVAIPLQGERDQFYKTLIHEMQKTNVPVTYFYPALSNEDADTAADTETVMRTLGLSANGSFVRALSPHIMFGSVKGTNTDPYIILQSTNYDVAFAGMLSWERHMSSDLAPFFGTPVSDNSSFTDALKSNRSIRILTDESGKERIVYAFVNNNLIIITTTTEALSKLIGRIN